MLSSFTSFNKPHFGHLKISFRGPKPSLLIPLNSAIYSDGKRPLVPIETGHPLSERSDAGVMIFYTILKLSQV